MAEKYLDCLGEACPVPLVKTQNAIKEMAVGDTLVVGIDRPEYYVNMARAWYFSFALIKQPEATLPLFERRPIALDAWTHNKALQKARESRRIAPERKAYLQSLKV